jgi:hypothetical protein
MPVLPINVAVTRLAERDILVIGFEAFGPVGRLLLRQSLVELRPRHDRDAATTVHSNQLAAQLHNDV